ncbi:MAG: toxin-antitoxin system HicB family antitoxin [Thermodesulfobacteriota bacterium]|nr:toxin-antitoxin system HicB family antitoxin [Thermodesulfobacteriota bacterium]
MSRHSTLIQWSEEDEAYVAVVPELPGLSAFGSSPEEAVKELAIAKEAFLEVLVEDGEEIPEPEVLKPFSGQTRLRLPKSLHASLANQAKKEEISLNTYIVQLLSQRNALAQVEKKIDRLADSIRAGEAKVEEVRYAGESKPSAAQRFQIKEASKKQ